MFEKMERSESLKAEPAPRGNADGCDTKRLTGKAIRIVMKTKGDGKWRVASDEWREKSGSAVVMDGAERRGEGRTGVGLAPGVTRLQTGAQERGWKLLIPKERFSRGTPPRVFCQKRLDLLDSKGVDFFESAQEAAAD